MSDVFVVFLDDDGGPLGLDFFDDRDVARQKARELSAEGHKCFILSLRTFSEVERFDPATSAAAPCQPAASALSA